VFQQAARSATASPLAVSSETTARVSALQEEVATLKAQLEDTQFQLEAALAKMQALQAQLEQSLQDSRDVTVHAEALARELAQATAEVTRLRASSAQPDEAAITDLSMRLYRSGECVVLCFACKFTCGAAARSVSYAVLALSSPALHTFLFYWR
jgi:predicted RNase H-like nuclease (RuvC/YqgF family)